MSKLINSLLSLAHAEGADFQGDKRPFDMTELIDKVMQTLDSAAAAKGLQIIRGIDITGDIRGYEDLVGQVLAILCENAVKYADDGGTVEVTVYRTRREIICTVSNTGEGIPSKDLPYIFDRFYRADTARTAETGYGLGLSIAKGIAEQTGGKLSVRSKDGLTEFVFGFEG
jgi:signal transduction histidine kinase